MTFIKIHGYLGSLLFANYIVHIHLQVINAIQNLNNTSFLKMVYTIKVWTFSQSFCFVENFLEITLSLDPKLLGPVLCLCIKANVKLFRFAMYMNVLKIAENMISGECTCRPSSESHCETRNFCEMKLLQFPNESSCFHGKKLRQFDQKLVASVAIPACHGMILVQI